MKYYYSLLEGLVLLFNINQDQEWAYRVINAKRDFKRTKNLNKILDLFGGKGSLNDQILSQQNEKKQPLIQAFFEELCCYCLKASHYLMQTGELSVDNMIDIHAEEYQKIRKNRKIVNTYSKEQNAYYQYQEEANDAILEGLKKNNIEKAILKHIKE